MSHMLATYRRLSFFVINQHVIPHVPIPFRRWMRTIIGHADNWPMHLSHLLLAALCHSHCGLWWILHTVSLNIDCCFHRMHSFLSPSLYSCAWSDVTHSDRYHPSVYVRYCEQSSSQHDSIRIYWASWYTQLWVNANVPHSVVSPVSSVSAREWVECGGVDGGDAEWGYPNGGTHIFMFSLCSFTTTSLSSHLISSLSHSFLTIQRTKSLVHHRHLVGRERERDEDGAFHSCVCVCVPSTQ